jgi:predicted Zn-dependent protease
MRYLRTIFAFALLATLLAGTTFATTPVVPPAGKQEPVRLRWRNSTIRLAISTSVTQSNPNIKTGTDVAAAIQRSVETWQNAADIDLQFELSERRNVSPAGVAGDGVSLITIAGSAENVLLFSKNPFGEAARTRVFYNRSGFITEADIILNPFQQFSADGTLGTFDLESTLTHEIGHLLGLRHSGVLGATMSESFSKNGLAGSVDVSARSLSASDIAAVRELYGTEKDESCCGTVAGKLTLPSGQTAANVRVWAESENGVVAAQTQTAADGTFRLGGLSAADYSVFWQRRTAANVSSGELGAASVEKGATATLNEKLTLRRSLMSVDYAGFNGLLSESAVSVKAGGEYLFYIGGKRLDVDAIKISFRSRFVTVDHTSMTEQNFADGITAVSFLVKISEDAPRGTHSLFVSKTDGAQAVLIGAIDIQ